MVKCSYCSNRCAYCGNLITEKGFTINDEFGGGKYTLCDKNCADKFEKEFL